MKIRRRFFKFYTSLFSFLISLSVFLVSCNLGLRTNPIIWITDVTPRFVCPGDNVTLHWNANEGGCLGDGCPAPVVVSIESSVLSPSLTGLRETGSIEAGPITSSPTYFTFSATGGADPRSPMTHSVEMFQPSRETAYALDFAPFCRGSGVSWEGVDLSPSTFRSFGIRLIRVCNTSGVAVTLNLTFSSGTQSFNLLAGQCTPDFPPELGMLVLGAYAIPSISVSPPGARCDVDLSLPDPIDMVSIWTCDVVSMTSEPIVAASPEPTQSGIIPLWTETPSTTDFILVIQVPANCRQGPGVEYPVVNSALAGEQIKVLGRNAENTWWYSQVDNDKCWISNIAGTPPGDLGLLTVIQAPPPPIPTATEKAPDNQPAATTEIDFDKDGYGVSVDCNDKNSNIHPGAVETPDDKQDSNCNGDDDT